MIANYTLLGKMASIPHSLGWVRNTKKFSSMNKKFGDSMLIPHVKCNAFFLSSLIKPFSHSLNILINQSQETNNNTNNLPSQSLFTILIFEFMTLEKFMSSASQAGNLSGRIPYLRERAPMLERAFPSNEHPSFL